MTWPLDAKILDAYLYDLEATVSSEELRQFQSARLQNDRLDVHASEFARAYRVLSADGSAACLRFWFHHPDPSLLETYSSLQREPELSRRFGLPLVKLIREAIKIDGEPVPAVLMDWVEGMALGDAVTAYLESPHEVRNIAEAVRSRFVLLNQHGVSHGDLRASNVAIKVGETRALVGLIDLDSLRWRGGPEVPRTVGGNASWNELRARDNVQLLESDYFDQALTYLTIVAAATNPAWWSGSTDDFLTLEHLSSQPDDILRRLEDLPGTPAQVAAVVRKVLNTKDCWQELELAMRAPKQGYREDEFWEKARRTVRVLRGGSKPVSSLPPPSLRFGKEPSSAPSARPVHSIFDTLEDISPRRPVAPGSNPVNVSTTKARLWLLVVAAIVAIGLIVGFWLFLRHIGITHFEGSSPLSGLPRCAGSVENGWECAISWPARP